MLVTNSIFQTTGSDLSLFHHLLKNWQTHAQKTKMLSSDESDNEDSFGGVLYTWTIERFSSRSHQDLNSPTYRVEDGSYFYEWLVALNRSPTYEPRSSVYCFEWLLVACWSRSPSLLLNANLQLCLLDREGRAWKGSEMTNCDLNTATFTLTLFPEDLRSPEWAEVVEDDTLRVQCFYSINTEETLETTENEVPQPHEINTETRAPETLEDGSNNVPQPHTTPTPTTTVEETMLEGLMNDSDFMDVTLFTKTKNFRAHKAILAARSKVFRAMLKSPMEEAASGVVNIPDFDDPTVEGMLQHIYKGLVENFGDKARSLLQISEKYDLPMLKEEAEGHIVNSLTVETAADDLVLAHMVNATLLKAKVVQFINQNIDEVKKTESFQNVRKSDPGLLLDLLYLSSESAQ